MALDVNDVIEGLDAERRRRVEQRAAETIAEEMARREARSDRPPVELSGIADPE